MNVNLLINLNSNQSSMVAYYYDDVKNRHDILETVFFKTKSIISNSTILNQKVLEEKIENAYKTIYENCEKMKFDKIDLILPFQIPIINSPIYENKKLVGYQKAFDASQFFCISKYGLIIQNKQKRNYSYFINKNLFEKYKVVFRNLNIQIQRVYTPALILGYSFFKNNDINAIIEIDDKKITYNFYQNQKVFQTKSINVGIDYILEKFGKTCAKNYNLPEDFNPRHLLKLMHEKSVIKNNKEIALMLFHGYKPGIVLELFASDLRNFIKDLVFKIFDETFNKYKTEFNIGKINNVCIYKNEFLYQIFSNILDEDTRYKWNSIHNLSSRYSDLNEPLIECFLKKQDDKFLKKAKENQTANSSDTKNLSSTSTALLRKNH